MAEEKRNKGSLDNLVTDSAGQGKSNYQFEIGQKVVYPAQGVAEIETIENKTIAGNDISFYVLRVYDTNRKIMVPIRNAQAIGLRALMSEQEIEQVYTILREPAHSFDNQTWNRRYRGFMDKIRTGSMYDVAEVLRDLYCLKKNNYKSLSFGERRMLDTARSLIVKEIAMVRNQTEQIIKSGIEAIFCQPDEHF